MWTGPVLAVPLPVPPDGVSENELAIVSSSCYDGTIKGKSEPDGKRTARCPDCGLYYAPAGLVGHRFFVHKKPFPKHPQPEKPDDLPKELRLSNEMNRMAERTEIIKDMAKDYRSVGRISDQTWQKMLHLFLKDYVDERGKFAP